MQLSVVLLLCFMILCLSGAAQGLCKAWGMRWWTLLLCCAALLFCNAFCTTVLPELIINPACVLLMALPGTIAVARGQGKTLWAAFGLSLLGGLGMLLMKRLNLSFFEPGLLLGLIGLVCSLPLLRAPYSALFCIGLSPLCMALWGGGLELYAFGYTIVTLGSPLAFDAQVSGAALMLGLYWIYHAPFRLRQARE